MLILLLLGSLALTVLVRLLIENQNLFLTLGTLFINIAFYFILFPLVNFDKITLFYKKIFMRAILLLTFWFMIWPISCIMKIFRITKKCHLTSTRIHDKNMRESTLETSY